MSQGLQILKSLLAGLFAIGRNESCSGSSSKNSTPSLSLVPGKIAVELFLNKSVPNLHSRAIQGAGGFWYSYLCYTD